MANFLRLLFPAIVFLLPATQLDCRAASVDYVDPFIGTEGEGNTYPGATLPHGFIQLSPDTTFPSGAGGYKGNKPITGFSHQHISGMGGPILGEISLMPVTGNVADPDNIVAEGKLDETASPGYYSVTLLPWKTKAELTCSDHVGFHRYTFPSGEKARLLFDVGHCLYGTKPGWDSAVPVNGEVSINKDRNELVGWMEYDGGRSTEKNWIVYFCARFDTPASTCGTWSGTSLNDDSMHQRGGHIGAYLDFDSLGRKPVQVKVGISWNSIAHAKAYLDKETPAWNFEAISKAARDRWEDVLGKVEVEGGTLEQKKMFYTALYHALLMPSNWTGESPEGYTGAYYENFLCMWDTFRTVHPLLTLLQPSVNADMINTLIKRQQLHGWTGDAHSAWQYEMTQVGTNADAIIGDAYVKGLRGVDWKQAYEAIKKNAFVDPGSSDAFTKRGRYRLNDYLRYHYVPVDDDSTHETKATSKTLEYIYNDYCVLQLAREFGSEKEQANLQQRLSWYKNVWDPKTSFMRGRNADGSWLEPLDPLESATGEQYYEGHSWTWSWYVPHDVEGLIQLLGGDKPFVARLKEACDRYYQVWNEPCMLQVYLFIYAGRPDLTQYFIRKAVKESFHATRSGLPGNDDSGTTSGWLFWSMLGIYPSAGQNLYFIGSPTFTRVTIRLENGKELVLRAPEASEKNIYVGGLKLNGVAWSQAWLTHDDILKGCTLNFDMADTPQQWGSETRPYSVSAQK